MNYEGVTPVSSASPLSPPFEGGERGVVNLVVAMLFYPLCSVQSNVCRRSAERGDWVGCLTRTDFLKNEFKVNNDHKSRRDHRPRCICGRLDFLFRLLFVFPKFY